MHKDYIIVESGTHHEGYMVESDDERDIDEFVYELSFDWNVNPKTMCWYYDDEWNDLHDFYGDCETL